MMMMMMLMMMMMMMMMMMSHFCSKEILRWPPAGSSRWFAPQLPVSISSERPGTLGWDRYCRGPGGAKGLLLTMAAVAPWPYRPVHEPSQRGRQRWQLEERA
eukprot:5963428-Karenia_brevis.AAC.1